MARKSQIDDRGFDGFNCKHKYLYHYTDQAGYNGILSSRSIRPSTIDGTKNTHYGRGVYLTPLSPQEISLFGAPEFLKRVFGDVTTYSVSRTKYFFCLRVDPNWYAMAARDPQHGFFVKDIWVVPGNGNMGISKALVQHGMTPIGNEIAAMKDPRTAERDYAYRLNTPRQPSPHRAPPKWDPPPYVFIGGRTVKRPKGWYKDAPSWWVPPR